MKRNRLVRRVKVSADGAGVVSHAGVGLLRELAEETGLVAGVSAALRDTHAGVPVHPPGAGVHRSGGGDRRRCGRDQRDRGAQHLFSLRMVAGGLRRDHPVLQQVQVIERIAEEAIDDMQTLLQELRPASLDRDGLVPALEEMCEAYRSRLGVDVEADLKDVAAPAAVEHALLRITQEAFTNAVRHGNARRLVVCTAQDDRHVELYDPSGRAVRGLPPWLVCSPQCCAVSVWRAAVLVGG